MNKTIPQTDQINTFSLTNRRILYTGAAGGLGHDTTLALLKAGAHVVGIDNDPEKIAKLQAAANSLPEPRLNIVQVDLSNVDALERVLAELIRNEPFDVLINNAAIYPSKPFEDFTLEEFRTVQAVNVDAAIICAKALLPGMRSRNWGRIINVSSITFYGGWENLAPYVQSKGALVGLTRAWAREFGKWGITVNAIAPGAFPTDAEKIHPNPDEYSQYVLDHQSIKRRGEAKDIANVIQFLASDAVGFVTGQTVNVDGGWIMN